MNCFDHNKLVAQYHPYHYENGATVHFWESPFVLFKVFKENVYAHIMYNDTIYAIICIHIQMALLHQALHGFVLTNMYVLLVIVLRSMWRNALKDKRELIFFFNKRTNNMLYEIYYNCIIVFVSYVMS